MKTISKRDLNLHTAKVLNAVVPDEPAIITERGVPKWKIESLEDGTTTINGMRVTLAKKQGGWRNLPRYQTKDQTPSQVVLDELREDKI